MRDRGRRTGRAYAAIPNAAMRDQTLDIAARGLLALLMTYSDDWTFVFSHIQNMAGVGREKLQKMLRDLEAAGYVRREVIRVNGGRVAGTEWVICDDPSVDNGLNSNEENRATENPSVGATESLKNRPPVKPTAGKSAPLRRTTLKKTNLKNPQPPMGAEAGMGDEINDDGFDAFWAAYPNPSEETAARRAWAKLASDPSFDRSAVTAAAAAYRNDARVRRGFAKLPANWLRDACWLDAAATTAPASASPAVDLDALARLTGPKIAAGRYVPLSSITAALADRMLALGLVSSA